MKIALAFVLYTVLDLGRLAHGTEESHRLLRRNSHDVEANESIEGYDAPGDKANKVLEPSVVRHLLPCPSTFNACSSRPLLKLSTVYQAAVVDLQCMLNSRNAAALSVDGFFGTKTETAVKNWQSKNSLAPDGIVGPYTWPSLCGVPTCSVVNPYPAEGYTGKEFNLRAQFIITALKACFPGKFSATTYVGHSSYGNSMDIWAVGASGNPITGRPKANMDALANWLMKNHASLKVSYMIFYNRIWNPSRDAMGVWADCCASKRCTCVSPTSTSSYWLTQGHYDHLHLTVL